MSDSNDEYGWLSWLGKAYDDYVAPTVNKVVGFAKENPLATVGAIHGLTSTGNLRDAIGNAAQYGAIGFGADKALSTSNWLGQSQGQAPRMEPAPGSVPAADNRSSYSPEVQAKINAAIAPSATTQGAASFVGNFGNSGAAGSPGDDGTAGESAAQQWLAKNTPATSVMTQSSPAAGYKPPTGYAADGMGPPASAANAPGVMGKLNAGMKGLADSAAPYQGLIKTGMQLGATLDKRQQVQKNQGLMNNIAGEESRNNARNEQITTDNNRTIADSNAASQAYSRFAPQNAFNNVINAGGRLAQRAGMDTGKSASQRAAEQRRIALNASTGAVTASANATRQPTMQGQTAYAAPSSQARRQAGDFQTNSDQNLWSDYGALAQQALGWDDKAKEQVSGGRYA
jgi:hypothetical protein